MPGYFLHGLSIEGFRGINNADSPLELRFDSKKVNSVFGHNGLGKSSIFEAVTYAIRGSIDRLDGMHRDEHSISYYNNCFHPGRKATIILTLHPDDGSSDVQIKVERTSTGARMVTSPTGQPNPEAFLKALDNPFLLLDQARFLQFVADTPLNRGRAFSSLLGLTEISETRQVLRALSNAGNIKNDFKLSTFQSLVTTGESNVRDLSTRIEAAYLDFFRDEIQQNVEYTTSTEAVVSGLAAVPILRDMCDGKLIGDINFVALEERIAAAENSEQRVRLSHLIDAIAALDALAQSEIEPIELAALSELVNTFNTHLALTQGSDFHGMLKAVEKVIVSPSWETPNDCPACNTELDRPLLLDIREELDAYQQVDVSKKAIETHWGAATWPERLKNLEAILAIPDDEKKHGVFREQLIVGLPSSEQAASVAPYVADIEAKRIEKLAVLKAAKESVERSLPPSLVSLTSKVKAAERLSKLLPELAEASDTLKDSKTKQAKRLEWEAYIGYAHTVFANAEVALSTEVALALEAQYQDSYGKITNNPEIVPVLERAQATEDLSLRLKRFHTLTNVPAASLLPESYRNALGIAIYLSAATQRQTTARFMVLDDITSSFDAGHQFSLMELIRTAIAHPANPGGPQVVLLSHDGLLEKYFDKISGQGIWHHHKLQGIPPTGNLYSHNQSPDRLRLIAQNYLSLGQIDAAEPLVRQYLEFVLIQIIRKVGILVPIDFAIQDDKKMVGNALDLMRHSIKMHKDAGKLVLTAVQENAILTVHTPAIIGNWVAHYQTAVRGSFNSHVLLGVLTTIDNLKGCFQYSCRCSGAPQPKFYKSLAEKHCGC